MRTRRDFLTGCAVVAAAAVTPTTLLSASAFPRLRPFDQLGLSDLAPLVGTTFRVVRDGQSTVRLRLTEAQGRGGARQSSAVAADPGEHQFSLLLEGRRSAPLDQDTYSLEHAVLGRFSMFIVPVCRPDRDHCFYEAIFNRPPGPVV